MNHIIRFDELPEPWQILLTMPGQGVIITNEEGLITFVSDTFEEIFSISRNEFLQKNFKECFQITPEIWVSSHNRFTKTIETWIFLNKKWFKVSVHVIKPSSFPLPNVVIYVFQNISFSVEEEDFFLFFKIFTSNAQDAMFLLSRDIIVACNDITANIFKTPLSQVIGRSVIDLSPQRQPDGQLSSKLAMDYITRALKGENFYFNWTHSSLDRSYVFTTRVNLSKVEFNNRLYLLAIVHDLSAEKNWIAKIEATNDFLSKINRYAVLFNTISRDEILDLIIKFYEDLFPEVLVIINKFNQDKKSFSVWKSNVNLFHIQSFERLLNKSISTFEVSVPEDILKEMFIKKISPPSSLTEVTFGAIKPWQSKVLVFLGGYNRFVSSLMLQSDTLYGSILLGFKKYMPTPDRKDLEIAINLVTSVIANYLAQKSLEDENVQRKMIFESLSVVLGIYEIEEFKLLYVNSMVRQVLGYEPEEVIGKIVFSFFAAEDLPKAREIIFSRIEGKKTERYEVRFVHKNGHYVWGLADAVMIKYQGKRCVLASFIDITPVKELQERVLFMEIQKRKIIEEELEKIKQDLIHSSRLAAVGQVSSFIAHELKNPLSAAGNALYLLQKKTTSLPDLQKYVQIARDEIQTCFVVINSVLQLNRLRDPVLNLFDLGILFKSIKEKYFNISQLQLSFDFDPDPFLVYADQELMSMVFQNLIKNSLESNPAGVRINIKCWLENDQYKVLFCDDGVGIARENHSRLFEPLFTSKTYGTGLGLTLCKVILNKHRGDIRFVPQEKGCCFELEWQIFKKIK